ncbi:MAG: hypothetical protein C0458_26680 [Methylobacterium sp.]|nr:hypothetical protein [Methylobacterium sp.]
MVARCVLADAPTALGHSVFSLFITGGEVEDRVVRTSTDRQIENACELTAISFSAGVLGILLD